ncbi:hypothetical protein RHMOL_Rhmol11G0040700 [Rhododendron molle]|uniref:Uncharacterized protein n=1 Tax=Rhododendron molle TaxID=49168 RepID=A0ACC0LPH8_RHOML|nr:hypothetical protein RHMOL_Rhmol11G0040700 [Rhododendron molle]
MDLSKILHHLKFSPRKQNIKFTPTYAIGFSKSIMDLSKILHHLEANFCNVSFFEFHLSQPQTPKRTSNLHVAKKKIVNIRQSLDDVSALPTCPVYPFAMRNSIMLAFIFSCCLFASKSFSMVSFCASIFISRHDTYSWVVAEEGGLKPSAFRVDSDVVLIDDEGLKPSPFT